MAVLLLVEVKLVFTKYVPDMSNLLFSTYMYCPLPVRPYIWTVLIYNRCSKYAIRTKKSYRIVCYTTSTKSYRMVCYTTSTKSYRIVCYTI